MDIDWQSVAAIALVCSLSIEYVTKYKYENCPVYKFNQDNNFLVLVHDREYLIIQVFIVVIFYFCLTLP